MTLQVLFQNNEINNLPVPSRFVRKESRRMRGLWSLRGGNIRSEKVPRRVRFFVLLRRKWFYVTKKNGKMGRCGAFVVGILSTAQTPGGGLSMRPRGLAALPQGPAA